MISRFESLVYAGMFTALLVLILIFASCTSPSPTAPTSSPPTAPGPIFQTSPGPNVPQPNVPQEEINGCDVIQIYRADIKVETDCKKGVRFYVPANIVQGTGYYNIWLPAINAGTKLGPFSYNVWSPWSLMETSGQAQSYEYQLSAETKLSDGTVYQCDRHRGEFTTEPCDTPCVPTEPECEGQVYDPVTCTWSGECECIPDGKPECDDCTWNPRTCLWDCNCYECDLSAFDPGCYPGNIDTSQHLFNYFGECLLRIAHTGARNQSCIVATTFADVAIVKGGPQFRLYTNVSPGDPLCTYCATSFASAQCKKPDVSHVSYFVCDASAQCKEEK